MTSALAPHRRAAMTTTDLPPDHLAHLRRPFAFGCSSAVFPADELAALEQLGAWMEALAGGSIRPVAPEHEHFLAVDRDEAEPVTVEERAWVRLKGRREFERDQPGATPPVRAEDYGMIEFDKDRCWW